MKSKKIKERIWEGRRVEREREWKRKYERDVGRTEGTKRERG